MKSNKIFIIIISLIVIIVIAILGVLATMIINNNEPPDNSQNIENQVYQNETNNVVENQTESIVNNDTMENMTIIEPIINPSNPNDNIEPTESFVSSYYYNQLDDTAKTIYTALKKDKSKLISGNHSVDYGTQFNTLLNSQGGQDKLTRSFSRCMGCLYL